MLLISAAIILGGPAYVAPAYAVPAYQPMLPPVYSSGSDVNAGIAYTSSSRYGSGWSFWLQFGNPYPPVYAYYDSYYTYYEPHYAYLEPYPVYYYPSVLYVPVVVKKPKPKIVVYRPWPEIIYRVQPYAYRIEDDDDYSFVQRVPAKTKYVVERPVYTSFKLPKVKQTVFRPEPKTIFVQSRGSISAKDIQSPRAFTSAKSGKGSIEARSGVSKIRKAAPDVRAKSSAPKQGGKPGVVKSSAPKQGGKPGVVKSSAPKQGSKPGVVKTQKPQKVKDAPGVKGQKAQGGKGGPAQKGPGKKK